MFLQSIGQSNLFTLYISFDSLSFNTCGYFARPICVWKKHMLMLNHRVRDLSFFHLLKICPLNFRHLTALSERFIRIFSLLSSIRPSHIQLPTVD